MSSESECKYLFKFILIGTSGVGKTCLMTRFADEIYESNQASTIGVDFKIKTINLNNTKIKLQIWDTAGQERFRAIVSNYYRGAHGILVVFDMTNKDSFISLDEWINEIKKNTKESVEIMILGNKIDKEEEIVVSEKEIEEFLEKHKIKKECFIKTSAKENIQVNSAFESLAGRLMGKFEGSTFDNSKKEGFSLRSTENGGKCCM
ncbi:Ras-related protein RAB1A [Vairimorpha necatrix]|uniref:Ras-related protein RAB1A n=1 Tax=Vairimorpha necatrix TaxID=6039 RepID=A0AAX4J908_9MICR